MRVLNQLGPVVDDVLAAAMPDVEVEAVPMEGPVREDLRGDALLSFRRAKNLPQVATTVPWVHIAGAGVEGLAPEIFDGRTVTCSRGAHSVPIAEFVLAAIMAFEKRVPAIWVQEQPPGRWLGLDELEAQITSGELRAPDSIDAPPDRWGWMFMGEMTGKTVGIVGLGGIGSAVAERAIPFGMNVVATRRTAAPSPVPGVEIVTDLDELLARADHLVLSAPVTGATHHLLDEAAFAKVKPGVHIVNVARGVLIDEDALIRALDDGRVAMASLDVASVEPLPTGHPLYAHPKVRMSPHISWASSRRQQRVLAMFVENVQRVQRGEEPLGVVDLAIGY